ncbi:MAG: hypothetical protein ABIL68_14405 [bacterium]
MKIIDLKDEHKKSYFLCLEDWSDEIKEAGDHKACWYEKMKDKGLCVKLAQDDNGNVGGMIQYMPIQYERFTSEKHGSQLINELWRIYRELQPYSPAFVSIPAIADVIGTRMINRKGILVERPDVERALDQAKVAHTKDLHFHVDKSGRRSFLSISQSFLNTVNS